MADRFIEALGFDLNNMKKMAKQIEFDKSNALFTETTIHGDKYNQVIKITGANRRKIGVFFGGIIRKGQEVPELVTATPPKRNEIRKV